MVILQQPSVLSYSGNLSDIILTDNAPVSLKLFKGVTLILEEIYAPDASGEINIRLKEVIDGLLSVQVPTADVYLQASAFADFTVTLNNVQNIIFRVIKGGVDAEIIDVDLFTKSNFLTWQPQQKVVKFHDPEWLTYYSKNASVLKAKAYYAESTEIITLAALPDGALTSVNVNYGHLISLFTSQPLYVDIWVELADVRTSFIQRYILSIEEFEFEDIFVFENSLGGVDSIRMTGEKSTVENFKFESALFDETTLDYSVVPEQVFEKNTGFFRSERERAWSIEFFKSLQKYYNHNGSLKSILISKPGLDSVEGELVDYKFNFGYSRQTKFLNLARPDVVPPVLEVVGPNEELFFLAPNLNLLPTADFDDSWLIPLQPAFDSSWYKLSIGSLVNYMQNNVLVAVSGGVLADYYNKATINSFFAGATPISGYNKANWDTAFTWGNHAAAGYALAANHYDKTTSDTRYIRNQNTLQSGAELNIAGGRFNNYLVIPTTAPTVPTPGAIWISAGGTTGGGPGTGGGAQFLHELVDVSLTTKISGQALVWNGAAWTNQNITPDLSVFYNKTQSDARFLAIGGTAVAANAVPFTGVSGKPTNLAGYGITDAYPLTGNPAGYLTAFSETDPIYTGSSWFATTNNSANWNTAFTWGNHAAAGYALTANHYEKSVSDSRYIRNQSALQAGAELNVKGGKFNEYAIIPLGAPAVPTPGAIWISDGGTSGGGPGGGAQFLYELVDVAITTPVAGQSLVWNGVNWINQNATVDAWTKTESDSRYLGIGGTAVAATYAQNSTRLYASDAPYNYGGGAPYYAYMSYNSGINRWRLQVSPATPAGIEVEYADYAGLAADSANWAGQVYIGETNSNPSGEIIAFNATTLRWNPTTLNQLGINNGSTLSNNISGSADKWNSQSLTNTVLTDHPLYIIGYDETNATYKPVSIPIIKSALGIPSAGDTLQSVTERGNTTTNGASFGGQVAASYFTSSNGTNTARIQNDGAGGWDFNYNTGYTGGLQYYGGGTTPVFSVNNLGKSYFSADVGIGTSIPLTGGGNSKWLTLNGSVGYSGGNIYAIGGVAKGYQYFNEGGGTGLITMAIAGQPISFYPNETLALKLDIDGTATFNGNVTAPTFTGALNGNAYSATYAELALKFNSSSHPGTFWLVNNWDGTYWNITSNHGAPARVGYADSAGTATNWAGSGALDNYLLKSGGTLTGPLTGTVIAAPKIQATETLIIPLGAPLVPTPGAIWIQTAP